MAQKPKDQKSKKIEETKEEQNSQREKMIKIGVVFVFLIVLIILLVTFCQRKDYAVTFMVDGKEYRLENVHNLGEIVKPKDPVKEGYTFIGWYVDGKEFDFHSGTITDGMKLEARFEENQYSITIQDGMGNNTTQEVKHDEKIEEPETPTREGYIFKGWYVGSEPYDFESGVKEDATIEAKWEKIKKVDYQVEHYLMGLDGEYPTRPEKVEVFSANEGSEVTPSVKSYPGFTSPARKTVTVEEGETTVQYYYVRNKYKLTLKGDNGIESLEGDGTYYYGTKVKVIANLKDGYDFAHWSNEQVNAAFTYTINNNTTLTATTELKEYTITYALNGGSGKNPESYNTEEEVVLSDPTRVGYTFTGWTIEEDSFDGVIQKGTTGNLMITANWEANTYTITYDEKCGGGDCTPSSYTIENKEVKLPTLSKEGYTFNGWIINEEEAAVTSFESSKYLEDLELKASFTPIKYTITYDEQCDGKDCTPSTYTVEDKEVKLPTLAKEGYTFNGWIINEEEEAITSFDGSKYLDNLELKASFTPITYTIHFTLEDDAECEDCQDKTYTIEDEVSLPTPTRLGYKFLGWTSENLTGNVTKLPKGTMGELTLTASWEEVIASYKVELYLMDTKGTYNLEKTIEKDSLKGRVGTKPNFTLTDDDLTDNLKTGLQDGGLKEPTHEDITITEDGQATLKYYYERNKFSLTVTPGKGIESATASKNDTIPEENMHYYGEEVTLEAALKVGYENATWSEDVTGNKYTMPASAKELTVSATAYNYTITYDEKCNRKDCTPSTYTVEDETVTLPKATKTGYTFEGWIINDGEDTVKSFNGSDYHKDLNLTAKFTIIEYDITYEYGDASCEECNIKNKYTIEGMKLPKATQEGKVFVGWKVKDDIDETITEIEPGITGDLTLEAVFVKEITLTYIDSLLTDGLDYLDPNNQLPFETEVNELNKSVLVNIDHDEEQKLGFTSFNSFASRLQSLQMAGKEDEILDICINYDGTEMCYVENGTSQSQTMYVNKVAALLIGETGQLASAAIMNKKVILWDDKELTVTIKLNKDVALTKEGKDELTYTLKLNSLGAVSKEEFDEQMNPILEMFARNNENQNHIHYQVDISDVKNGKVVYKYTNDELVLGSTFVQLGTNTAIDMLKDIEFIDRLEVSFSASKDGKSGKSETYYISNNTVAGQKEFERINPTEGIVMAMQQVTGDYKPQISTISNKDLTDYHVTIHVKFYFKDDGYVEDLPEELDITFAKAS